jgi:hypothetical protein
LPVPAAAVVTSVPLVDSVVALPVVLAAVAAHVVAVRPARHVPQVLVWVPRGRADRVYVIQQAAAAAAGGVVMGELLIMVPVGADLLTRIQHWPLV